MATVTVGSLPGEVTLVGVRGDKWGPFEFRSQTPVDLSGDWIAQVRVSRDRPADVLAEMVVDDSDAAEGVIRVSIVPAESGALATGPNATPDGANTFSAGKATYYWDAQRTATGDPTNVKTWFRGPLKVEGDVAGDF